MYFFAEICLFIGLVFDFLIIYISFFFSSFFFRIYNIMQLFENIFFQTNINLYVPIVLPDI